MKTVSYTELEGDPYRILVDVVRGETYTITDDASGKAIAQFVPIGVEVEIADEIAAEFGVGT